MQISPMAQVALLHTEMNSGLRFVPRIGMNSAAGKEGFKPKGLSFTCDNVDQLDHQLSLGSLCEVCV